MDDIPLIDGYVAREVSEETFQPVFDAHYASIFGSIVELPRREMIDDSAAASRDALRKRMDNLLRVRWLVYHDNDVVGWTMGAQKTPDRYGMSNSVIFPEHRGRGVYTALLNALIARVAIEGFQVIESHHHATNNAVLVPKLKTGFVITGTEFNDIYGLLVTLSYFVDQRRRDALDFRVGGRRVSEDVVNALGYRTL